MQRDVERRCSIPAPVGTGRNTWSRHSVWLHRMYQPALHRSAHSSNRSVYERRRLRSGVCPEPPGRCETIVPRLLSTVPAEPGPLGSQCCGTEGNLTNAGAWGDGTALPRATVASRYVRQLAQTSTKDDADSVHTLRHGASTLEDVRLYFFCGKTTIP